ncbi:MAG: Rubrerythrin-2 [Chloroflexi bacterium ADurb.Bin325]|nr:MAG: Rubrerythrin-2 [Chloroflexi bacterium ADurb.Bin325]
MKATTLENIKAAFAGESQAHMKYMVFAERAERDGFANIARLFRAASLSEQIHATNHLRTFGLGKTAENLEVAFDGESYEIHSMYPEFIAAALADEEKRAQSSMEHALAAEKVHAALYAAAKEAVAAGKDSELGDVYVCGVCGYTMEGEAPDKCPICGASHTRFTKF